MANAQKKNSKGPFEQRGYLKDSLPAKTKGKLSTPLHRVTYRLALWELDTQQKLMWNCVVLKTSTQHCGKVKSVPLLIHLDAGLQLMLGAAPGGEHGVER